MGRSGTGDGARPRSLGEALARYDCGGPAQVREPGPASWSRGRVLRAPSGGADVAPIRLVLLGTAGGPSAVAGRAGIGHALVVGGDVYVVDAGLAAVHQYLNAGLAMERLAGIFVTHLHADHVTDYINFFLEGVAAAGGAIGGISQPVDVYGPGRAGRLLPFFPGLDDPIGGPAGVTPGLADLTRLSLEAHAYSLNMFRQVGHADLREIARVHEIPLPDGAEYVPTSRVSPFPVMEDDNVRVSATLVPHAGCLAFAFRFDAEDGSVVFSGDTGPAADNLCELAAGADVLVHEVCDIEAMIGLGLPPALADGFRMGHTDVNEIGAIAARAGVKILVLDHFIPPDPRLVATEAWSERAQRRFTGRVVVGDDLMQLGLDGLRLR